MLIHAPITVASILRAVTDVFDSVGSKGALLSLFISWDIHPKPGMRGVVRHVFMADWSDVYAYRCLAIDHGRRENILNTRWVPRQTFLDRILGLPMDRCIPVAFVVWHVQRREGVAAHPRELALLHTLNTLFGPQVGDSDHGTR